jgi:KR domain
LPFESGGTYLVTGGVGGIGEQVASLLVDRFHANLLLIGRSALDERGEAILDRLRQRGGSIAYESVNVCDESRLAAVVNEYTARLGRSLDGVVHLAGIYYESVAVDDAADRFLAMLRPKTIGTTVLHRLLAAQGGGFLIGSSSIAGFFGGASIGAYSAANSFQDAFAAHAHAGGAVKHYCFSWSNWNDVGQSRQYQLKDAPRARGYQMIAPSQGLQSLLIGLRFGERRLLVGLDAAHRHIRRSLVDEPDLLDKPVVYYTAANGCRPDSSLRAMETRDRFGTS